MSEMKSAWEKAMERAEKLGKPSDEELKQLEHIPTGSRLAATYLGEEKYDLAAEISKYKDAEIGMPGDDGVGQECRRIGHIDSMADAPVVVGYGDVLHPVSPRVVPVILDPEPQSATLTSSVVARDQIIAQRE